MKIKHLVGILLIQSFILCGCSFNKKGESRYSRPKDENITVREDFRNYFDSCGVEGSVVIYDVNRKNWIVSDTVGIHVETLPASTFKIVNLLIALETKIIKDENEVLSWVGSIDTIKYGYRPEIYHDMSVKEAFKSSAWWVFVELAKKIGKENYKKYLSLCNYGNNDFSQKDADFWNFGNFAISPKNQVEFLDALYSERLPFSKRNINILKKVMITEQTKEYKISAKTGWTREHNINTGWWTGYVETNKGTYIFSTRLLQDRKFNRADFGSCRKEITKKIFRDLKINGEF